MAHDMLSEEETMFKQQVRKFADREIAPHAQQWDTEEKYPRHLFKKLGELGWMGVALPESVGGSGGGAVFYALLCSELARGSAAIALGIYVHSGLACSGLYHLGNEEQQKRFLPQALNGEKVGCFAYAEPGSGADVSMVATRARREGDTYVLNGSKLYITNAPFSDFVVVVASTAPEQGLKGLSLFIVERGQEGMSTGSPMKKLGMGASEMSEIVFDACRVPASNRLGPEGGFMQAIKVLTLGRIAAAALGVGLGRAALEAALSYTRERIQFGGPIINQQFIRMTLASMATKGEAAWRLTLHAARLVDAKLSHDTEASMAKVFSSETATWACERALHLCGAQGYMRESPAQRLYRDCKVFELGEGSSEILRETIARNIASGSIF